MAVHLSSLGCDAAVQAPPLPQAHMPRLLGARVECIRALDSIADEDLLAAPVDDPNLLGLFIFLNLCFLQKFWYSAGMHTISTLCSRWRICVFFFRPVPHRLYSRCEICTRGGFPRICVFLTRASQIVRSCSETSKKVVSDAETSVLDIYFLKSFYLCISCHVL